MYAHTAYFDDSGKKEQGVLVVGGYISSIKKWTDFEADWRLLLAKKHIDEFKRADFNARVIGDWPNPERDHFLRDLAQIIHRYTKHAFAIVMFMPEWHKANQKYKMTEYGFYPYPLCARTCIRLVRDWCDENKENKGRVQYIFDKGSEHASRLLDILRLDGDPELRALAPVPADSKLVRPIQAADYFAWEVRHQGVVNPDPDPSDAYKTLRRLLRFPNALAKVGTYDFARLDELCAGAHVPLR